MTTWNNYTQADLGAALAGVPCGLSPLDLDKIWAEREEMERLEPERPITLPTASPRDIANELSLLTPRKFAGRPHE